MAKRNSPDRNTRAKPEKYTLVNVLSFEREVQAWNFYEFLGLVGFCLYLAWIWLVYYASWVGHSAMTAGVESQLMRCFLLLALSISLLIVGKVEPDIKNPRILVAIAIAASLFSAFAGLSVIAPSSLFLYISWLIAGVGYAALLVIWAPFISALGSDSFSAQKIAIIMMLAAFLFAIVTYMYGHAATIVISVLPMLSACFALVGIEGVKNNTLPLHYPLKSKSEPRKTPYASKRYILFTWIYSVALGISGSILMVNTVGGINALGVSIALVCAGVCLTVLLVIRPNYRFNTLVRFFLPISIIFMLPMAFPDMTIRVVCASVLVGIFTAYGVMNLALLTKSVAEAKRNFLQVLSWGRFGNSFGMLCGWLLGFMGITMEQLGIEYAMAIVIVVVAIVFTVIAIIMLRERFFPETEQMTEDEEAKDGQSDYGKACKRMMELYDLSFREYDVLCLLGQGRNAEAISGRLFVSKSTVKSHMQSIYRKTGVHSQQELIDVIGAEIPEKTFKYIEKRYE